MKSKITVYHISMIAFAIVINLVGGQIALMLKLPIYLDSMGTIFIAAVYGPFYGAMPSILSGLILGMTSDIYALYYAPVGILLGMLVGIVWKKKKDNLAWAFLSALFVTIPTSLISACITAYLFGGITSSGSTFIVQLLAKTPLGLTLSCFIVQLFTDYLDRIISILLISSLLHKLPQSFIYKITRQAD